MPVARVDASAGRSRDRPAEARDIHELLFARIATSTASVGAPCDAEELVAQSIGRGNQRRSLRANAERRGPSSRARALRARRARGVLAKRGEREQQAAPTLPWAAPARSSAPKAMRPSRFPRRVAVWPTASATPLQRRPCGARPCRRSRRGGVVDEPGHEHALGELDADMSHARARSDVPVDPAHVVTGLVWPHLVELAPTPGERGAVVACEQPVDPAPDRELQRSRLSAVSVPGPGVRASLTPDCGAQPFHGRDGRGPAKVDLRRSDRRENLVEHLVRGYLFRECLIRQNDAMTERVADEIRDIARQGVVTPSQHRERAGRADDADRPARARAVGDVRGDLVQSGVGGCALAVARSTVSSLSAGST